MRTPTEPLAADAPLNRQVAACLAAVLEVDPAGVPVPEDDHPEPCDGVADLAPAAPHRTGADRRAGRLRLAGPWLALWIRADDGTAVPGTRGDRYYEHRGTFSNVHGAGYDLTPIEGEVLDTLELPDGGRLTPEDARRNLVTRGIDLGALVGRHFTVGDVRCFGQRLCEPCVHLERMTARAGKPGTLRALIHQGRLRADVLSDGEIRVGDAVVAS